MLNIKGYIFLVKTVTLTFPVHELSALDWSEKWFLTCSSFTIWSIWMKLHRYVGHQRLHMFGKDRHSCLSRLRVIHPWLIWKLVFWPVVHFIRPCSLFPIDNLSIYAHNFFKFCIHIVIGDEWYGIVNGQNPTIFDGVTALSPFKKWFLACCCFTVYDIWYSLAQSFANVVPL